MLWHLLFLVHFLRVAVSATSSTSIEPKPTPSTLVDILSSQAQYSYFLRTIQRHGLIPKLNTLQNVTLLAPINLAFAESDIAGMDTPDQLLRYIVDQRFRVGYLSDQEVVFNTLYNVLDTKRYTISVSPDWESQEYVVDKVSTIVDPDIYAKHQHSFIQGLERLLPLKPSLCQFLLADDSPSDISFVKHLFQLVFAPSHHDVDDSRHKAKKLPTNCEDFMKNIRTVFVPNDEFIRNSLLELEIAYYTALYRTTISNKYDTAKESIYEMKSDILQLLSHLMLTELVGGANGTNGSYFSQSDNVKYHVSLVDNRLVLNKKISSNKSAVLANGIIHTFALNHDGPQANEQHFFEALGIPTIDLIPRRALNALHYSNVVKELKFRKLMYLIDGSTVNQTIFMDADQRDDSEEVAGSFNMNEELLLDEDLEFSGKDLGVQSFSSKQSLMYQFSSEVVDPSNILENRESSYRLLDSRLCSKKRIGGCFQLKLSASKVNNLTKLTLNDDIDIVSSHSCANNTFIYIGDKELNAPSSLKHSLGDLISNGALQRHVEHIEIDKENCLATLGYLNEHNLYSLDDKGKGYTVFLPCAKAYSLGSHSSEVTVALKEGSWNRLGLVLDYLESKPKIFKDILKGMFIEGTVYSDFGLVDNDRNLKTVNLRGDRVEVKQGYFDGHFDHIITLNETKLPIPLNSDILFNQGVVHIIKSVLLPQDFQIPFKDLLETATDPDYPHHSFTDLIKYFPKLSSNIGLGDASEKLSYSLLIPSSESLKDFNITSDYSKLLDFIEYHLVPNSEVDKLLYCLDSAFYKGPPMEEDLFRTNMSDVELRCYRNPKNGKSFIKLHTNEENDELQALSYNKDHEVKVLSHGCTSFNFRGNHTNGACVFLIEKPLNLDWLHKRRGDFLHIHLGFVSVGVGIILGLIIFGGVMVGAILCLGSSKNKLDKKVNSTNEFIFPTNDESSFMRVRIDDDLYVIDRGYETDVDVLRSETDQLLPLYGTKKYKKRGYGSIPAYGRSTKDTSPPKEGISAPRSIKGNQLSKGLNRDRNIPGW
ncbi:uncharacterized protein CANTADRAFT_46442 [Suhomyces tanzawaensis NRRL Y-17324]|uniref:FAS1 domain-containing protein n=1 Tax=Suhomyces tanzawaensis NRRL Y-17324 TaxID=984487 RepID=A0A1E4SP49_9ASCO|nr:uncharacterized protein CANTADRAFT_46442 [Suhomyces tanzawaensis NRRL Y-17324]ODV81293.1 hypothetical protein CANTADRAFT_46442 [Suhomyces tanzawaensis NRRL Y-17324]